MKKGFVALVGAGPGEVGLLTLRGKELIEKAEVVVYDRLVSSKILQLIPKKAQRIDVGKESSKHLVAQNRINEILLEKALEGNLVVRLKGGDPFVFGRGGEELELLNQNNIPFEVVPGITSAISAPCFAGIPVTHRDFCSSLHIITGHQKENEPLKINFDALVKTEGTLVFLMGVASLKAITSGLILAGMDKKTPAGLIQNGTRPNQRKLITTLENLYEESIAKQMRSPCIIIVGKVCSLSDSYDWFSKKPLFGKKVVVTRPKASQGTLSIKLKELGADVFDYPCIEIKEIKDNSLEEIISTIKDYTWLVFTSKNGVDIFFDYLNQKEKDVRVLSSLKFAVVGSQTKKALAKRGILADYLPQIYDGEHLGKGLVEITSTKDNILLLRASKGSEEIINALKENGCQFKNAPIYDTIYTNGDKDALIKLFSEEESVYVTFTSASTVEGFVNSTKDIDLAKVVGICIGKQTAKLAQEYGIKHYISKEATIDSIIEKIMDLENIL